MQQVYMGVAEEGGVNVQRRTHEEGIVSVAREI
jgi:hypothetical protein